MSTQPNLNRAMQRKARWIARERGVPYQTVLRELAATEPTGETASPLTAAGISKFSSLQHVRHRPGMYVGGSDKYAMHRLLWQALEDSLAQYQYGAASEITVHFRRDGSVEVRDDGGWIGHGEIAAAFTELSGSGVVPREKPMAETGTGRPLTGSLHGLGPAVINALSSRVDVSSHDGYGYSRHLKFIDQLLAIDEAADPSAQIIASGGGPVAAPPRGTALRFLPDQAIFGDAAWDRALIEQHLQDLARINAGLRIHSKWDGGGHIPNSMTHHAPQGLGSPAALLANPVPAERKLHFKGSQGTAEIEVAFWWARSRAARRQRSWVNDYPTHEGGTHVKAAQRALRAAFSDHLGLVDKESGEPIMLTMQALTETLCCDVSVRSPNARYRGQSRSYLESDVIEANVRAFLDERLAEWVADPENTEDLHRVLAHLRGEQEAQVAMARVRRRGTSAARVAEVPDADDRRALEEARIDIAATRTERLRSLQAERGWSDEQTAAYEYLV